MYSPVFDSHDKHSFSAMQLWQSRYMYSYPFLFYKLGYFSGCYCCCETISSSGTADPSKYLRIFLLYHKEQWKIRKANCEAIISSCEWKWNSARQCQTFHFSVGINTNYINLAELGILTMFFTTKNCRFSYSR